MGVEIRTVLLVDDDPDIRKVGEMSLSLVGGWRVLVAGSGPEALAIAASDRPDVVLLDLMMPDVDGFETLARLRADPALADIPVIVMTARVHRDGTGVEVPGALGILGKPFDALALPARIRELLA